jgi:hypothetical protein
MSRDRRKLEVFVLADEMVVLVCRATAAFPVEERYGLLRLGMLGQPQHDALEPRYGQLVRRMQKLINSLGGRRSP